MKISDPIALSSFLHCLSGLTCWRQGALCLTEAVQIFAGFVSLSCLWFCIVAQETLCSPSKKEVTEVRFFFDLWSNRQYFQWNRRAKRTGSIAASSWFPLSFHTISPCVLPCWKIACALLPQCSSTGRLLPMRCLTALLGAAPRPCTSTWWKFVWRNRSSVKMSISATWRSMDRAGTSWDKTWQGM